MAQKITLELSPEEISLIAEALDSHEYWQLSDENERNNGSVFIPGDVEDPDSKMYIDPRSITEEDKERYEQIQKCRELSARLERLAPVKDDK